MTGFLSNSNTLKRSDSPSRLSFFRATLAMINEAVLCEQSLWLLGLLKSCSLSASLYAKGLPCGGQFQLLSSCE